MKRKVYEDSGIPLPSIHPERAQKVASGVLCRLNTTALLPKQLSVPEAEFPPYLKTENLVRAVELLPGIRCPISGSVRVGLWSEDRSLFLSQ